MGTSVQEFDSAIAHAAKTGDAPRVRALVERHYNFVWRTVRYLGVPDSIAEDAAQQVFCVLASHIGRVAMNAEMSFLFSTALRVASEARRKARRRPDGTGQDVDEIIAPLPSPEELVDQSRAREVLREVLDAMPMELRVVFVLFELEELSVSEIASMTGLKQGTAASRLRRARECFQEIIDRRQAAQNHMLRRGAR